MRQETIDQVLAFRDRRDWKQYHTPKDLAISLCLGSAELLEVFQWSGGDTECREKLPAMREELADVLMYAISLADRLGLDLDEIVLEKLRRNEEKYPVEKARGRKEKYTELA